MTPSPTLTGSATRPRRASASHVRRSASTPWMPSRTRIWAMRSSSEAGARRPGANGSGRCSSTAAGSPRRRGRCWRSTLDMNRLLQALTPHAPIVTDGAWGTQLQVQGLPIGACPDAWNLRHPDRVEAIARAYVEAGSRVLLTNTFGANRIALARHGLEAEVAAINRAGVAASRRAAGTAAWVFASMGPTGVIPAAGEIPEEEVRAAFAEQA